MQIHQDPNSTVDERRQFGLHAWREAEVLEQALESHTCDIERAFMFHGREYLAKSVGIVISECVV